MSQVRFPPSPPTRTPGDQAVLDRLEREDATEREQGVARAQRLRQVTPDVGRYLHTLVLATRPSSIVEVATSGGYSTVWLATAARCLGVKLGVKRRPAPPLCPARRRFQI